MKNVVTLNDIEKIKTRTEDEILLILNTVEESTGCDVVGVSFYQKKDEEDYKINLDLQIKHRENLLDK